MKRTSTLLVFIFVNVVAIAQDVHFSQYWNNGIQYNPAMAGVIPANLRASIFYRNQWSSVNSGYNSYGLNFDARIESRKNTSFGFGVNLYKDVAGDLNLSTTHAQLAFSTIVMLDRHSKLSFGINGGLEQKGIDPSAAEWNSQYSNGSYNPAISSGESFNSISEIKGDISAGIVYYYSSSERYMRANDQFNMKIGFCL